MADIRQYHKEKENIAKDDEYQKKLAKHRIRIKQAAVLGVAIIIIAIIVVSLVKHKSGYSTYKTESSMRREDSVIADYYSFGGCIVRCSRDGIAAYHSDGTLEWNSTFEVNNLSVDKSGDYLAVADLNGNAIHTYNTSGFVADINTSLPILQIKVSKAGYVVAVLEDENADYINMYSMEGEKIYTIKKTISIDGLPVSVSVSPDGEKLIAAFTAVNDGTLKTSVVFYNFNEVGQNENERVVGGYDFGETMVGNVEFVNATTAIAFAEDKICIYTIKEYPSLVKEISIEYEVESIFTGSSYFGILHKEAGSTNDTLEVYDTSGNKVYTSTFDKQYSTFTFSDNDILMYNDSEMCLMSVKGKTLFTNTFEDGIVDIIPVNSEEYYYINKTYIKKIKLK